MKHFISKSVNYLFWVLFSWSMCFLEEDASYLCYSIFNLIDQISTYVAMRNYIISKKGHFNRLDYFKVALFKYIQNFLNLYLYERETNVVKMIIIQKLTFLGLILISLFEELSIDNQYFIYKIGRIQVNRNFLNFLTGFSPFKLGNYFHWYINIPYYGFVNKIWRKMAVLGFGCYLFRSILLERYYYALLFIIHHEFLGLCYQ